MKSSNIKGFPRFTVTDKQCIEATPKRKASGSNPLGRTTFAANNAVCGIFLRKKFRTKPLTFTAYCEKYSIGTGKAL